MRLFDQPLKNEKINLPEVEKYLRFLLTEINRYKEDWEISKDEFDLLSSELNHFKEIVNNSEFLPQQLIEDINSLSFYWTNSARGIRNILRYIIFWDAYAFRKNQIDSREIIELLGYDIKSILAKYFLKIK